MIDTGVLRTVDERQWAWLERALDRATANSHGDRGTSRCRRPRYASGRPPKATRPPIPNNFGALYRLLARNSVRIAMGGDTHDFEYYREQIERRRRRA